MSAPFQYFTLRRALFCITYLLSYLSHIYFLYIICYMVYRASEYHVARPRHMVNHSSIMV